MRGTAIIILTAWLTCIPGMVSADPVGLTDNGLSSVSAQGVDTAGGNFSSSCANNSSSVCVGTYDWTDNHQFDSSTNKGAIIMDGYVQQNVSTELNGVGTQSALAQGVNVVGNLSVPLTSDTLTMNNFNNATMMIGGF